MQVVEDILRIVGSILLPRGFTETARAAFFTGKCVYPKKAGGIWKISVAHKFIPTQMSDSFQVFSRL